MRKTTADRSKFQERTKPEECIVKEIAAGAPKNSEVAGLREELDQVMRRFLRIAKLKDQIDEDTAGLETKALQGDQIAITTLYYLASRSTETLNEVAKQKASLVRPLAQNKAFWPV